MKPTRLVIAVLLGATAVACGSSSQGSASPGDGSAGASSGGSAGASSGGSAGASSGGNAGRGGDLAHDGGSLGDASVGGPSGGDAGGRDAGANGSGASCASPVSADDGGGGTALLTNGDFSAGTTGWEPFGPSTLSAVAMPARSGTALAVKGRTDTWNGAAQSVLGRVKSGQMLQLHGWVRLSAGTAPVGVTFKSTVAGTDSYAQVAAGTANATAWTEISGTLTLSWSAEPTAALLYIEGPPAGVDVYLDDVVAVVRSDAPAGAGNADGTVTVTARVDEKHQVLEGFGASIAWYQDDLVKHPKSADIYPIIFAELGLDVLRLRNRHQRSVESVDLGVEATILAQATKSLGHPPKVLMSSWSPPGTLKASGKENCTNDATTCTLVKVAGQFAYSGFANYWSDALDAYAAKGIVPDLISIQNEPDFLTDGWEGCQFAPREGASLPGYDQALKAVADRLAARAKRPKLLGPETLGVHWNRLQSYVPALDATLLYGWAHHLYEKGSGPVWLWQDPGPDAFIAPMAGAAQVETGKPIFMTEFQTDEDTLDTGGFETAWLMHDSLAEANASAWLYWNLVWKDSGLVALAGDTYRVRDQYYALRHFAKFTEPGDTRVTAGSNLPAIRATAWLAPDGSRLTTVLLNVGAVDKSVQLSACGYSFTSSSVVRTVFRTDGTSQRWEDLGPMPADAGVQLPSRSVATIVLRR